MHLLLEIRELLGSGGQPSEYYLFLWLGKNKSLVPCVAFSLFVGPTITLRDCLSAFFSADELKGDNMYSCEQCKK